VTRRLGLLGGECTGKTTLAEALSREWGAAVVPERLRAFVEEHGRTPRADEQAGLLQAQQEAEDEAAAAAAVVVADPAALMTAIYSVAYFADDGLLDRGCRLAAGYDLLVWCGTGLPWAPDGLQRDGPHERARVDGIIGRVVRERLEPAGIVVAHVDGPTPDRVRAVRRAWHRLPPEAPT
jgi:nicotinamide riboside kinase